MTPIRVAVIGGGRNEIVTGLSARLHRRSTP